MKIQIDITPEEFKELFVPGEKQQEFTARVFEAYTKEMQKNTPDMLKNWTDLFNIYNK